MIYYATTTELKGFKKGKKYLYRVGEYCSDGLSLVYSGVSGFEMPKSAQDTMPFYCGALPPDRQITNRTPIASLESYDEITAAGFPITLLQVSGGNGVFSGVGYVSIPMLKHAGVKVQFSNITVNTDRQLIGGYIQTTYDPNGSGIVDLGGGNNNNGGGGNNDTPDITNADTVLNVVINSTNDIILDTTQHPPVIVITDADGNTITIPANPDGTTVIVDANGNVFTVVTPGDNGELSEVIVSTNAKDDKIVKFKINENIYFHNQSFYKLYDNKTLKIEFLPANDTVTIAWDNIAIFLKKNNESFPIDLQEETKEIENQSVTIRYIQIVVNPNNLISDKDNELIVENTSTEKVVAKLKIKPYHVPVVKFDMENNYTGSYFFDKGFDEQTSLKKTIMEGNGYYHTFPAGKSMEVYYTPVLGVPVGEEITLKVDIKDYKTNMANDSTFKIVIKARKADIIKFNGSADSIVLSEKTLTQIDTRKTINIKSLAPINGDLITPSFIDVMVQSTREKIGQIEYYSATPTERTLTLVYVKFKDDFDYPTSVTASGVQNYLNERALNQLFVKLTTVEAEKATLNLNKSYFMGNRVHKDTIMKVLKDSVLDPIVDREKSHDYYCITNLNIEQLGGAHYVGERFGYSLKNNSMYGETNHELIAHELGHWLGLPHPFQSNENVTFQITSKKGDTENKGDNFMDYNLRRKRWFKIQLINIIRKIK